MIKTSIYKGYKERIQNYPREYPKQGRFYMKVIHRAKALSAYEGARVVMATDNVYATYMLLKEAVRGILAYIVDDKYDYKCTHKTKLHKLLEMTTDDMVPPEDKANIQLLIDKENDGLESILAMDMAELKEVKRTAKKLIADYMKEPV